MNEDEYQLEIRDLFERIDELEQEVKHWQMECREAKAKGEWTYDLVRKKVDCLEQERNELKRDNKRMKAILEGCGLEENGDCTYCNVDKAYHELKQENKELKIKLSSTKCHLCGEGFLTPEGAELYEEKNNYRSALEKIKEIVTRLKSDYCSSCGWYNTDSCEPQEYTCGEFIRIQNKIDEVLK